MPINRVMVTGAAGSIGSEVCRRLRAHGKRVVGFDQAETPLFWLDKELNFQGHEGFIPVVGSVTDSALPLAVRHFKPDVIIHAAALKHVGMCARNVCQAVLTNVHGTGMVARAALEARARIVLVSTDKAVEPTTVMGATKRLSERIVAPIDDARIVRLVNIWDSAGSIVPVVREQLAKGEIVTITDMRMERYFMGIGDAADMVLREALAGDTATEGFLSVKGSRLTVPSRLKPRLIADVIKALAGDKPYELVEIGMQPGEKLCEQLMTLEEENDVEVYDRRVRSPSLTWGFKVRRMVRNAIAGRVAETRHALFRLAGEP